jgi:hypothetical protein
MAMAGAIGGAQWRSPPPALRYGVDVDSTPAPRSLGGRRQHHRLEREPEYLTRRLSLSDFGIGSCTQELHSGGELTTGLAHAEIHSEYG